MSPLADDLLSRRRMLALIGAGTASAGATLLAGCSIGSTSADQPSSSASCVPRASLESYRTLGELPLVYEVSQKRAAFRFESGFFTQLGAWLTAYTRASGLAAPDQVWNYGGWIDGGSSCDSWHNAGRAFDLGRLRLEGGDFVSCRYDQWRSESGAELDQRRRQYWALAASLHLHFAYVLTYLYNDQHANHIHVDNGRSGDQLSTLSTRSRVQVQAIQAICTYLWDEPTELTGRWDSQTRSASRRVLDSLQIDDDLDDSTASWHGFLTASMGRSRA